MNKKIRLDSIKFGLIIGALLIPIIFLIKFLGRFELIPPVIVTFVVFGFSIRGNWEFRNKIWFWAVLSVLLSIHILAILLFPWKVGWVPAPLMMLFSLVELFVIYGGIVIVEKYTNSKEFDADR